MLIKSILKFKSILILSALGGLGPLAFYIKTVLALLLF